MAGNEEVEEIVNSNNNNEEKVVEESQVQGSDAQEQSSGDRLIRLPITRIKHIIKTDPDVNLASSEAVVALTKAAELFIQMVAKDAVEKTLNNKRKTLQRKDLDIVLETRDSYTFLEGFYIPIRGQQKRGSSDFDTKLLPIYLLPVQDIKDKGQLSSCSEHYQR